MDMTLEHEHPSSEPLVSNTKTMETYPPRVSRIQEGAQSPDNVYRYEFPEGALINPKGRVSISNREGDCKLLLLGMAHRMEESFPHHLLCPCHKYGSNNDMLMR
jgi:hypothetical protein